MKVGGMDVRLDKEMKRGIAKIIILSHIKNKKTYPYAILKLIRSAKLMHGYKAFDDFTKSDVYNILSSLEKDGFIRSRAKMVGNKVQKMYTVTKKGEAVVRNKDKIFMGMIESLTRLIKEELHG